MTTCILNRLVKKQINADFSSYNINNHISKNLSTGNSKPLFRLIPASRKGAASSHVASLHNCGNNIQVTNSFVSGFQSVCTVDDGTNQTIKDSLPGSQHSFEIDRAGVVRSLKS